MDSKKVEIEFLLLGFEYTQLPTSLQSLAAEFYCLAWRINSGLKDTYDKIRVLSQLMEARDTALRTLMHEQIPPAPTEA